MWERAKPHNHTVRYQKVKTASEGLRLKGGSQLLSLASWIMADRTVRCEVLAHGSSFLTLQNSRISRIRLRHQMNSRDQHGYVLGQADMLDLELIKCICPHGKFTALLKITQPLTATFQRTPPARYVMFLETNNLLRYILYIILFISDV